MIASGPDFAVVRPDNRDRANRKSILPRLARRETKWFQMSESLPTIAQYYFCKQKGGGHEKED
jgi:hypothetical protein